MALNSGDSSQRKAGVFRQGRLDGSNELRWRGCHAHKISKLKCFGQCRGHYRPSGGEVLTELYRVGIDRPLADPVGNEANVESAHVAWYVGVWTLTEKVDVGKTQTRCAVEVGATDEHDRPARPAARPAGRTDDHQSQ